VDEVELASRQMACRPSAPRMPLAGALEKYAAQVGSAYLGAVTHSGNLQWEVEEPESG
jgi:dihydroxy-acid dehydratase